MESRDVNNCWNDKNVLCHSNIGNYGNLSFTYGGSTCEKWDSVPKGIFPGLNYSSWKENYCVLDSRVAPWCVVQKNNRYKIVLCVEPCSLTEEVEMDQGKSINL